MGFYAIVLAAGKGKRMRDESAPAEFPKVLRQVLGRPMIAYVIDALTSSGITDINVIVGYGADFVKGSVGSGRRYIVQDQQLGSGHAVACAKGSLGRRDGHAIIMCGDSPIFTAATISSLKDRHLASCATITMVSSVMDNPAGYGRIRRGESGDISGVVEEKCASSEEKSIREINGGAYAFESRWLWENIEKIERNEAGELNLTDLVRVAISQGMKVEAMPAAPEEVMGANTPEDIVRLEDILKRRAGSGTEGVGG
jgi:bifunctional UDP-N-acetylglucosamine pyrophosphorylase/glucosamine-1-phosphate N-acetyltransferase